MSSVLLDTSFLYELTEYGFANTPDALRRQLDAQGVVVSVVSIWEVRIKWNTRDRFGRRKSPITPDEAVETSRRAKARILDFTLDHARASLDAPIPHRDPFDEQLLIQAQVEGLRLLTTDRHMVGHPLAFRAS